MVTLPQELIVLLAAGIGFLVTNGLKSLFPKWDMSVAAQQITAALVTCVVGLGNQLLAFIPPQYQQIANNVFSLLIAVFGVVSAFGVHYSMKQLRPVK